HDSGGSPSSRTAKTRPSTFLSTPSDMSLSSRYVARRCARQLRSGALLRPSTVARIASTSRRYNSTETQAAAPENPKIAAIVDQISQLTLLETADLVSSLKVLFSPFCSSRRHPSPASNRGNVSSPVSTSLTCLWAPLLPRLRRPLLPRPRRRKRK